MPSLQLPGEAKQGNGLLTTEQKTIRRNWSDAW